jgi:hypothetical protein
VADFGWRGGSPGGYSILGGAAVHRCDKHPVLNLALQIAEKLGFVSGHRFSDAVSPPKSDAPLGAGRRNLTFSANCLAAEAAPLLGNDFFRSL